MPIVTQTPLPLGFFIQDITTALLTYNRLVVFRSRDGAAGPYDPATEAVAGPAVLSGEKREPHQLNGKTLSLLINGVTQVDIPFLGADPYTTADVIADIIAETALVTPTEGADTELVLTTVATGSAASIKVLESDAASFLGFQTDQADVGVDANIVLVSGTHEYFYTDQNSDLTFFYRYELLHTITAQQSVPSVPIPATAVRGLDYASTITCYFKAYDMQGRPISGRRATIANVFLPNVYGTDQAIFRHYCEVSTDDLGYAETRLIRGARVDFSIEGTNFVRRLQIPLTGDSVNLFDSTLVVEDEFGIQEPNIDFAIRLS